MRFHCARMRRILFFLCVLSAGKVLFAANVQSGLYVKEFPASGSLQFDLKDNVNFSTYCWPQTLLSYNVRFSGEVRPEQLRMKNLADRTPVVFQLSETETKKGYLAFAKVCFFSDLPSGAERNFELYLGDEPLPKSHSAVTVLNLTNNIIEINGGSLAVRIPASQCFQQGSPVPGPILSLNRGNGWIGHSFLRCGSKAVRSLQTDIIESGDLFARVRLHYAFEDGAVYTANIRVVSGYEFIEFDEEITGLSSDENVLLEMQWDGFAPARKFGSDWDAMSVPGEAWPAIDRKILTGFIEEDPHWYPNYREDSEEMLLRLSPYCGNSVREASPHVSFWDDRPGGQELGVFVLNHSKWQDYQYSIWQPSTLLQVRFCYDVPDSSTSKVLTWRWPLVTGTRSTAITLHDAVAGEKEVEKIRAELIPLQEEGIVSDRRFDVKNMKLRYIQLCRARYGFFSLDRKKNWILEYPEGNAESKPVFDRGSIRTAAELEDKLFHSSFVLYPLGVNTWPGINSIQHRFVYEWAMDAYNRLQNTFTPEQRRRINALLLTAAYITAGEEMHPVRTSLAGCPNMAADGWCVPIQMSFLFPDHPMAAEWRDQYEKNFELSSFYYTRPAVPSLESRGGRWAESLALYNWGYFRPVGFAQFAGFLSDGKNRFTNPSLVARCQWFIDMLSAPIYNPDPYWRQDFRRRKEPPPVDPEWKPGMVLDPKLGFMRQYPSHGAHGSGTTIEPLPIMHVLGCFMQQYRPLLAEHLMWVSTEDKDFEYNPKDADWLGAEKKYLNWENCGTPPELTSCKYTGQGIVLRAGVNTPEELSIYLEQIDRGPNYRWGYSGEGASGSLYFCAQGRCYTGHEHESAGDRDLDDTDGVTTFGVMKNGEYRSIGMNLLERPLYDLGVAQFAELVPREGPGAYSWPEYKSRNILLVGTDYFILSDEVGTSGRTGSRFTWFTAKDQPFPHLIFLNPMKIRQDHWTELTTAMSCGFQRDSHGTQCVLVTHKDNVQVEGVMPVDLPFLSNPMLKDYRKTKGFRKDGIYGINTPSSHDLVFRDADAVSYNAENTVFDGKVGVVRRRHNGTLELAMMQSHQIGADGITLQVDNSDMGISLVSGKLPSCTGRFFSRQGGRVTVTFTGGLPETEVLYVDSAPIKTVRSGGSLAADLPPGAHTWELSAVRPVPERTQILRTENSDGGARVFWGVSAGAESYRLEISTNGTASWQPALNVADGSGKICSAALKGLSNGHKVHLRIVAVNPDHESEPSAAYPLYVSDRAPLPPDGLVLRLGSNIVEVTWGDVLGTRAYRLYRRPVGSASWTLIFEGLNAEYTDRGVSGVVPAFKLPGKADNALTDLGRITIYEYAVSSVSGNGEGEKSISVNTDPRSWLNWQPDTAHAGFRRRTAFWQLPYVPAEMVPPDYPGTK